MPKYRVQIPFHCTVTIEMEADTKEEAEEKGREEATEPSLCWSCSKKVMIDSFNDEAPDDAVEATEIS